MTTESQKDALLVFAQLRMDFPQLQDQNDLAQAIKLYNENKEFLDKVASIAHYGLHQYQIDKDPDILERIKASQLLPDHFKQAVAAMAPIKCASPKSDKQFVVGSSNLYVMHNKRNGLFKIGISANPQFRERTLQGQEPEVELLFHWPGNWRDEQLLHARFAAERVRGEWFRLSQEQVEAIRNEASV